MYTPALLMALLPSLVHSLSLWPFQRRQFNVCLTQQQGEDVASNYAKLFTDYSDALATEVLASDWSDQTDSVAWLLNNGTNCPYEFGATTFKTRASYEVLSSAQPDISFEVLNVWVSCSNVIVRWRSAMTPEQVQGIAVLDTTPHLSLDVPFQISHTYSEFNSGAWGVNEGICDVKAGSTTCSS